MILELSLQVNLDRLRFRAQTPVYKEVGSISHCVGLIPLIVADDLSKNAQRKNLHGETAKPAARTKLEKSPRDKRAIHAAMRCSRQEAFKLSN